MEPLRAGCQLANIDQRKLHNMPASKSETNQKHRKPSAFDVAREAGVSQTTVSFILNRRQGQIISDSTRDRVMEAVNRLGYRPNTLASSLAKGKTHTVGLLLPIINNDFHAGIVNSLQGVLHEHGYRLMIVYLQPQIDSETAMVELFLQHRVDALAMIGRSKTSGSSPEWLPAVQSQNAPFVVIDDCTFDGQVDCVVSDDFDGMNQAIQHLFDLGHRRIGMLAEGSKLVTYRDRTEGYHRARTRLGLDHNTVINIEKQSPAEKTNKIEAALAAPDAPTAFVTYNDYVYEDLFMNRSKRPWRIPEDLSVVGYGNQYLARFCGMTSVHQHPDILGRAAGERLLKRLAQPELGPETLWIPVSLTVRETTGPCRVQF